MEQAITETGDAKTGASCLCYCAAQFAKKKGESIGLAPFQRGKIVLN